MHACAVRGWLHEAVCTSCLHTNQRWCLLSALILVNTDVCVRKRSDRCMIEVLKCRHSQQLSSLWISRGSCIFCPDNARVTSFCNTPLMSHLTDDTPYPRFSANCKLIWADHNSCLTIPCFLLKWEREGAGQTCVILLDRSWLAPHGLCHLFKDFASKTDLLKRDL